MIRNLRDILISYWSKHGSKKIKLRKSKLLIYDEYLNKYVSADELLVPAKPQQIKTVATVDKTDILLGMLMKKFVNPALDILTPGACNSDLKKLSDVGINQRYSTINLFWKKKSKIKHKPPALPPVHEETNDIQHATGVGWAGQATRMTMQDPRPEHGRCIGCPRSQCTDPRQREKKTSLNVCREDKQAPSPQQNSQVIKSIPFEKDKNPNTNCSSPLHHETNNYASREEPPEEKQHEKPQCSDFEVFPQKVVEKEKNMFSSICTSFQSLLMSQKKSDSLYCAKKENMKIENEICTINNSEDQINDENTKDNAKSDMHHTPYEDPKGDKSVNKYNSPECQNRGDKTSAISDPQPSQQSDMLEVKIKSIENIHKTDNMCPESEVKDNTSENEWHNIQTENTFDEDISDKCLHTEANNMATNKYCRTKTSQISFKNDATSSEHPNLKGTQIIKTNVSEVKESVTSLGNTAQLKNIDVNIPLHKHKEYSSYKNMACTSESLGKHSEMPNTSQHVDSRASNTIPNLYQQKSNDEMNMTTDLSKYKYDSYMGFKIQKPPLQKTELKGKTKSKTKIKLQNLNQNQSNGIAASPNKTNTDKILLDKTSAEVSDTNKQALRIKSTEPFTDIVQDTTIRPICQKKPNEPASTSNQTTGPANEDTRQCSTGSKEAEVWQQNEMFKVANNGNEKEKVMKSNLDIKSTSEGQATYKSTVMTSNTLEFPNQVKSEKEANIDKYSKYIKNGGFKKENLTNIRTEYNIPTGVGTIRSKTSSEKFKKDYLKQQRKTSNVNKSVLKTKDQKEGKSYYENAFNRSVKKSSRKHSATILLNRKVINKSKDLRVVKSYTDKPSNKDITNPLKRHKSAIIHSEREIINKPNKGKLQINKGTVQALIKTDSTKLTKNNYKKLPLLHTSYYMESGTTLNFKSKVNTGGTKTYNKTDIKHKVVQDTSLDNPQNIKIMNKKSASHGSLVESKSTQLYPYNDLQHEILVNPLPCTKKVKLKSDTAIKFEHRQTSNSIGNICTDSAIINPKLNATKMSSHIKKNNTKRKNDNAHVLFLNDNSCMIGNIKGDQARCEEEALKPTSKPFFSQLTQHYFQGKKMPLFKEKPNIKLTSKSLPRDMNENFYLEVNNENNKSSNEVKIIGVKEEEIKSLFSKKENVSKGKELSQLNNKNNNSNRTLNGTIKSEKGINYNFKKVTIIKTKTHKNIKTISDINDQKPVIGVKSPLVKNKKILHKSKELEKINGGQKSLRNMPNELTSSNKIEGMTMSGKKVDTINIKKSKSIIYIRKPSVINDERPKTSEVLDKQNENQDIKKFTSDLKTKSVINNKTKPVANNNEKISSIKPNDIETYNVKEFKKLTHETQKTKCTNNLEDRNNIENKRNALLNDSKLIQHFNKAVDETQKRQNTNDNNIQKSTNILPSDKRITSIITNMNIGQTTNCNINKPINKNKINNNSEIPPPVALVPPNATNISSDQINLNESLNSYAVDNNSKQRNGSQFNPTTILNNQILKDNKKISYMVLKRVAGIRQLKNNANKINDIHNIKMHENKLTETKDTIQCDNKLEGIQKNYEKNQKPTGKPEVSFCNETPMQNNIKFNLVNGKTSNKNNRLDGKTTEALGKNSIKRENNKLTTSETKKTINSFAENQRPKYSNKVSYFYKKNAPNNTKAISMDAKMVKENITLQNMNINMIKNDSIETQKTTSNNKALTGIENMHFKSPQKSHDKMFLGNLANESKIEINAKPHVAKSNVENHFKKHEIIKSIEMENIISNKNALQTPVNIVASYSSTQPATVFASPYKTNEVKPKSQDLVKKENVETPKKNGNNQDVNKVIIKSNKVQVTDVTKPDPPKKHLNQSQKNPLVGSKTGHSKIKENITIKPSLKNTINHSPINVKNNTTINIRRCNKITEPITTLKPFLKTELKIEKKNIPSLSKHDIHNNIVQEPITNNKIQSIKYNIQNSTGGPEKEMIVNTKKEKNTIISKRFLKILKKYPEVETYRLQKYKINSANYKTVEGKSGCVEEKMKERTNSDTALEITDIQRNGEENKPLHSQRKSKEQSMAEIRNVAISYEHDVQEQLNERPFKVFGQKPLTNNNNHNALTNNESKAVVEKSNEIETPDIKPNIVHNLIENKPPHDRAQLKNLKELTKRNSINTKAQVFIKDDNDIKPADELLVNANLLQHTKKTKECNPKSDKNKVISHADTIRPGINIINTDYFQPPLNSVQVMQSGSLFKKPLINTKVHVINHHKKLNNHVNEKKLTNTEEKQNTHKNDINNRLTHLNDSIRTSINRSIRSTMSSYPKAAIIDKKSN